MVVGRAENSHSCGTASHGLGLVESLYFWITVQNSNVVSGWKRGRKRLAIAGVLGQAGVAMFQVKKHGRPKMFASRSEPCSSRDHTRPAMLSVALAMVLTMNARRFQRTQPFRGMVDYPLNASKDIDMGVIDFAPTCGSEPVVDGVRIAVVGSDRSCHVLDAGSGREDESSDVCCVGENTTVFL